MDSTAGAEPAAGWSGPHPHAAFLSAQAGVLAAVAEGAPLVLLLGAPGTGKTVLLGALAEAFRGRGVPAETVERGEWLTGEEAAPLLLVDEADRVGGEALARLAAREPGPAILAVLPVFAAREDLPPHRAVRLGTMAAGEAAGYVAARLRARGLSEGRVSAAAVPILAKLSGGVPRLLDLLLGSALFAAGEAIVGPRHVAEAAAMHAGTALPEAPSEPEPTLELEPDPAPPRPGLPATLVLSAEGPRPSLALTPERRRSRPWPAVAALLLLAALGGWALTGGGVNVSGLGAGPGSPLEVSVAGMAGSGPVPAETTPPAPAGPGSAPSLTGPGEQGAVTPRAVASVSSEVLPPPSASPIASLPAPPPAAPVPPRPAVAAPPPRAAEPAEGLAAARVVLHHREGARDRAEALLLRLGSGAELREVPAGPTRPVLRYFHPADRPLAESAAARLGAEWAVQDFTDYAPRPSRGTLEVWLPGR